MDLDVAELRLNRAAALGVALCGTALAIGNVKDGNIVQAMVQAQVAQSQAWTHAQTLQVATLPYIRAAEMAGCSAPRLLLRHVLPNIAGPLMVVATSEFGLMILFEAGLSFLGLGIQPPYPSWGSIMSAGRQYVARAWWLTVFPGACLFVLVLCVNVFGDWLRDRVDPRSRGRG